jgi:hypothetical protein
MSLNSLKIATDGYLKRTSKAVLIIAVAGYLNYTDVPPTPPSGGGGGGYMTSEAYKPNEQEERRKRILIEDSILVQIVEITLKTTII